MTTPKTTAILAWIILGIALITMFFVVFTKKEEKLGTDGETRTVLKIDFPMPELGESSTTTTKKV